MIYELIKWILTMSMLASKLMVFLKKNLSRSAFINSAKLLFLACWGLALGACMNDAGAQELVFNAGFLVKYLIVV